MAFAYIIGHAGPQMISKKDLVEAVERRVGRSHLHQDLRTLRIPLHHPFDSTNLTLNPVQPVDQIPVFLF